MNAKTAETYLPCFRAGKPLESRVAKAVKFAEGDMLLRERLASQAEFDERMIGLIRAIEVPEEFRARGGSNGGGKTATGGMQIFHPAMLSVLAGALLIVGFVVWTEMDHRGDFPGKEAVQRIISIADDMNGGELEPTQVQAGQLGDAFYMRGFEGFTVPPELAKVRAVGTRMFRQAGHPIAQLAIDPHNALLYVFRANDFGVNLREKTHWELFQQDQWVAAVRQDAGICTVVAFQGDVPEMEDFLKKLTP